jgi:hypothetical protein
MWISAAIETSKAKRRLLRDPQLWLNFDSYFAKDWQAMEIIKSLHAAGADLRLLGEFAIWTFHPLANDEARGKLTRGRVMKRGLRKAIAGHESAIEACSLYSTLPGSTPELRAAGEAFRNLLELNTRLAAQQRDILVRAQSGGAFKARRLGSNWKRLYIFSLKAYILRLMGWNDKQILGAITHLVSAAHKALGMRVPSDLRVLLRKALRAFEQDPQNRTVIALISELVANPHRLYQLFPPVSCSTPQAAA